MITIDNRLEMERLNIRNDFENITFDECTEEERAEIVEEMTRAEYDNDTYNDYDIADNDIIYINAVEKMGYITEGYKKNRENLRYNLSYSQGDYAYLMGKFDLIKLIEKQAPEKKQLLKDLKTLKKNYMQQNNLDLFYMERIEEHRFNCYDLIEMDDFEAFLNDAETTRGKKPIAATRVYEYFFDKNGISFLQNLFITYEYKIKQELYNDLEYYEQLQKKEWQEEVLKEKLKNGFYNRKTKIFYTVEVKERQVKN